MNKTILIICAVLVVLYLLVDTLELLSALRKGPTASPFPKFPILSLVTIASTVSPEINGSLSRFASVLAVGVAVSAVYWLTIRQLFNWAILKYGR